MSNKESRSIKRRVGRPTKVSEVNLEILCEFLEKGSTIEDACMRVNISPRTYQRWRLLGMQEEDPVYTKFYFITERARAKYRTKLLNIINEDAQLNKNVKTAMWLLERNFPRDYSLNPSLRETKKEKTNLEISLEISDLPKPIDMPLDVLLGGDYEEE